MCRSVLGGNTEGSTLDPSHPAGDACEFGRPPSSGRSALVVWATLVAWLCVTAVAEDVSAEATRNSDPSRRFQAPAPPAYSPVQSNPQLSEGHVPELDRGRAPDSLPLRKRREQVKKDKAARQTTLPNWTNAIGSLAVVLGLFLLVVWGIKKATPAAASPLPSDVVEILGRVPLAARHYAHLVRVGNRMLLVSLSPNGAETLTEITEPSEVDRLAGLCKRARPDSTTGAFRNVLQQFALPSAPNDNGASISVGPSSPASGREASHA